MAKRRDTAAHPGLALQPDARRIESDGVLLRILLICLAAVLAFGAATFLLPRRVWSRAPLVVTISPEILFLALLVLVVLALYLVRYESEARKLRLLTQQQALAAQADHATKAFDAVTNVFTRNFLQGLLEKEISRSERNGHPLALMMCDLDNFKRVNDRYGHLMGDEILAQVAAILKSCLRGSDHVVRYGGDEFLMILPDTDEPGAAIVRDRIVQRMVEWDSANRIGDVPISLSLGVYHHRAGQTVDYDLSEVDARMYAEKRGA